MSIKGIDDSKTLDDLLHSLLNKALVEINAPAGSLMAVDKLNNTLQIKARLGPPREQRTQEPTFKLTDKKGIALKLGFSFCKHLKSRDPLAHGHLAH